MKRKTILKKIENGKTKTLSIRVPVALHQKIEHVRKRALTSGLEFPISEYLLAALTEAVRQAEDEIKLMTDQAIGELDAACLQDVNIIDQGKL